MKKVAAKTAAKPVAKKLAAKTATRKIAAKKPAARKPAAKKATAKRVAKKPPIAATPEAFIAKVGGPRGQELAALHALIRKTVPKLEAFVSDGMGGGLLAYGPFHYKYASGREGDWFRIGVASNKNYISLYACAADQRGYVAERYRARLPRADIGKSCVRFKRLDDLDPAALEDLLRETAVTGFGI